MTPSRILAVAFVALVASTVACSSSSSSDPPAEPAPAGPTVKLQGVYQSTAQDGPIAVIEFVDDSRYRAWLFGGGPCADLKKGDPVPDSCAEIGHYVLTNDVLTLTEDRSGKVTSFGFKATAFVEEPGQLTPKDQLVGGGQQLAQSSQVTASNVQLTTSSGQTQQLARPSTSSILCHAACWGVAGLGTAAVALVCTGASVITIGGLAVPCSVAVLATGAAAGAGASVCADALCP